MEKLAQEISDQFARHGTWRIDVEQLPNLLDVDPALFYQELYGAAFGGGNRTEHSTIEPGTLTQTFDAESAGELVDVLELFAGEQAERELASLGAFLPHPLRVELTARFFDVAREEAQEHTPDWDTFRSMLRTLGSYERARDVYFAEYFSRDELMRQAARTFVAERSFRERELAEQSAVTVLQRLFRGHILELSTALASVAVTLFELAVTLGYARRPEDEFQEERAEEFRRDRASARDGEQTWSRRTSGDTLHRRVGWAREVMELPRNGVDAATVKQRYKQLMLRYHPDINPGGHRTAQRINAAYGLLLEVCETPA